MPRKQYKFQIDQALADLKALHIQYADGPDVPQIYWKLDEPISTLFEKAGLDHRYMQSWWFVVHALASIHEYNLPPSKKWTDERRGRLVEAAIYLRSKAGNSSLQYSELCNKLVRLAKARAPNAELVEIAGTDLMKILKAAENGHAIYAQLIIEIANLKSCSELGAKELFAVAARSTLKKIQPKK